MWTSMIQSHSVSYPPQSGLASYLVDRKLHKLDGTQRQQQQLNETWKLCPLAVLEHHIVAVLIFIFSPGEGRMDEKRRHFRILFGQLFDWIFQTWHVVADFVLFCQNLIFFLTHFIKVCFVVFLTFLIYGIDGKHCTHFTNKKLRFMIFFPSVTRRCQLNEIPLRNSKKLFHGIAAKELKFYFI